MGPNFSGILLLTPEETVAFPIFFRLDGVLQVSLAALRRESLISLSTTIWLPSDLDCTKVECVSFY